MYGLMTLLQKIRRSLILEYGNFAPKQPLDGCIFVALRFYMPRPRIHFKTSKGKVTENLKEWAKEVVYCSSKPDIDNMEKFVFDACTGLLWEDDKHIVQCSSVKLYGKPRTEIEYCLI